MSFDITATKWSKPSGQCILNSCNTKSQFNASAFIISKKSNLERIAQSINKLTHFYFVTFLFDVTPFFEGKGSLKIPAELKECHHVSLTKILSIPYGPNVTLE